MPSIQDEILAAFTSENQKGAIGKLMAGGDAAFTDVSRELGLDMLKNQQEKKLQALTDPVEYNKDKATEYDNLAAKVRIAYDASFAQYIAAGYPRDSAKAEAMKVARSTKESNEKAISSVYGSETSEIAMAKLSQAQTAKYGTAVKF